MNYNYTKEEVHITDIQAGDTIERAKGSIKLHQTVCQSDIKSNPFMGRTLFGDSYRSGRNLVARIIIHRALPNI